MIAQKKLRLGLIGIGNHAIENLIPAINTIDEVRISAVCSRDFEKAKTLAETLNAESAYNSYEELINSSEVDAVVASATPEFHEVLLNHAIKSDKHIFVEKPPFTNLNNLGTLYDEFQKSDAKPVMQFGFNFRYSDFFSKLEELSGNFAQTKLIKIKSYSSKPTDPMWVYSDVFTSSLYAIHIHAIEMLCYMLGELENTQSTVQWLSSNRYVATIIAKFKNGTTGILELSNASNKFEYDVETIQDDCTSYKVEGFNKFIIHGSEFQHGNIFKGKEDVVYEIPFLKGGFERTGYSNQFRKFVSDIQNERVDVKSLQSCKEAYKLIEAITK